MSSRVLTAGPSKVCASAGCPSAGERQPWEAFDHFRGYRGRQYCVAYCKPCRSAWHSSQRASRPGAAERAAKLQRARRARARKTGLGRDTWLDAAPFASWLRAEVVPVMALADAGPLLGVTARLLRAHLAGERQSVRLTTVDTAVTRWGDPGALERLYPSHT